MTSRHIDRTTLATVLMAVPLLAGACSRNAVTPSTDSTGTGAMPVAAAEPVSMPPATTTPDRSAPDGTDQGTVVLAAGQSVRLASSAMLGLDRVVNDSRCPADVQCVWAGEVTISLSLKSGSDVQAFQLSGTTAPKATVLGHGFELQSFGPCPAGHPAPTPIAECATLRVTNP